jgi:transcriptional regulator with XRE-family HTH domain
VRREELAQLCEVSPSWLTWLEQGRQVQASGNLLSPAERAYLFSLADRLDPHHDDEGGSAGEALDAVVAAIDAPAYIQDRQWNAVAWNRQAAQLFAGWLGMVAEGAARPNLLRFMFLEPNLRRAA